MEKTQLQIMLPLDLIKTIDKLLNTYIKNGLNITRKDLIGTILLQSTHIQLNNILETTEAKATDNMRLNYLYYRKYYEN